LRQGSRAARRSGRDRVYLRAPGRALLSVSQRQPRGAWSALLAALKAVAFALAAVVAVGAALVPAMPAPVDLPRTLLSSPSGPWEAEATLSAPVDQRTLGDEARGYGRVWNDPTGGSQAQAIVYQSLAPVSGAEVMADLTKEYEGQASGFSVAEVEGARGFVRRDLVKGLSEVSVVFRRGQLVFRLVVVDANPELRLARTLAVAQDERAPAGENDAYAYSEAHSMGAIIGGVVGAVGVYLFIVNGGAGLWRRRRRSRMFQTTPPGKSSPGIDYVDVSEEVDLHRRVTRGAFAAKLAGAAMTVPALSQNFLPYSLPLAVAGLGILACGVGLERRRRSASVGLSIFSGVFALSIVGIPFAVIMRRASRPVLRGQLTREAGPSRGSRYRRLFTGKRRRRVGGLLAVAALLTVVGLLALWLSALTNSGGETAARQMLSALACVGLAVLPYRRARRLAALEAASVVDHDPRAPILYLRSFGDDHLKVRAHGGARRHSSLERFGHRRRERFEEIIAGCLWAQGPVIAVSEPGERLAPLGAARTNFDDASWQAGVETLMAQAGLIVIAVGRTAGLAWEISRIAELELWDRTILLFPPAPAVELENRWKLFIAAATAAGMELAGRLEPTWVLTATVGDARLLAYEGPERDEWHYESALSAAAGALLNTRPESTVAA
jgi:hypothetical protein